MATIGIDTWLCPSNGTPWEFLFASASQTKEIIGIILNEYFDIFDSVFNLTILMELWKNILNNINYFSNNMSIGKNDKGS